MRETKFRFWCEEVKIMSDGFWLDELIQLEDAADYSCLNEKFCMQYTGLKDKNGVEIYEGDIVKIGLNHSRFKDDIAKIKYSKAHAGFRVYSVDFECEDNESFPLEYRIEVIGNIYEHPHLLENT